MPAERHRFRLSEHHAIEGGIVITERCIRRHRGDLEVCHCTRIWTFYVDANFTQEATSQ